MSIITQRYALNLQPGGVPVRIPCTQGDIDSRVIRLLFLNGSEVFEAPTGTVMTVDGTKPDGTSFSYSGSIYQGSYGAFYIKEQMAVVPGEVTCQVTLTSGSEVLGTAAFYLDVQENAIPATLALSQTTMESFQAMKNAAAGSASNAATSADAAAASAAQADAYKRWLIPYGAWRRYDTEVSTNVLAIATGDGNTLTAEKNQPATIMTEDASTLTNSPVTSGGFWARRTVYPVSNPTGSEHITVELEEYEPVLGRRWLRTYYAATGKWSEKWVEISPASPLDQMVSRSATNINDYTGAGLYWMNKTTVTNTPNGGTGMLIVTTSPTGNVIYQTFVSFNTGSGYVATRCYTNSQWYPWDERPAPASYVTQEGTSGAWRYRIWSDGKKECWLSTSIQTEITFASGSLFCSSIIPYPYPVTFTGKPTAYVGVRSAYAKPIWGIPSTPDSGTSVTKNAYLELVTTTSTASYKGDIYIYACGV
nr:MAG TPA: Tail fiber protein [Caudoviricetes sp.]